MSGNVTEAIQFSNISASPASFTLRGGRYCAAVAATFGGGSVQLQMLGPDLATWFNLGSAYTVAGSQNFDLPAGQYRWVIVTATAVYLVVANVPV